MTMLERKIGKIATLCLLILFWISVFGMSTLVYAQQGELYFAAKQGDSSWEIVPLAGPDSVEDFYAYSNDQSNTGLELSDQSILFLYKNTTTGKLSLIVIHDKPGDGSGGSVDSTFTGLPEFSEITQRDDPDARDTYEFGPPETTEAKMHWEWMPIHDDGIVIGELGEDFEITITMDSSEGIEGWNLLSGDLADPDEISLPSLSEPLTIMAKIGAPPQACFNLDKKEPIVSDSVTFDGSCSSDPDGEVVEYEWDFGDGTSGKGKVISHVFTEAGVYTVTLTVVDNDGLKSKKEEKAVNVTRSAATATRAISTPVALPGSTFRVSVTITAKRDLDGLGLEENLPVGWTITPIDNGGSTFKRAKSQWLFAEEIKKGEVRCIVYEVTVPQGLVSLPGYFSIQGTIDSVSPAFHTPVEGDIKMEIHACLPVTVAMAHLKKKQLPEGQEEEVIDLRLSNEVTTEQVQRAREYWKNEERVPKTCGAIMELEELKELTAHSLLYKPIDEPLPQQELGEVSQIASRTILTPILPNIIYLETENEEALRARVRIEIWADRDFNGLGIDEQVPQNWRVEPIENAGAAFRRQGTTVQWAFTEKIKAGEIKSIVYEVQVPKDAQSNFCGDSCDSCEGGKMPFVGFVDSAAPRFKTDIIGDDIVRLPCCLTIPLAIAKLDTEYNKIDPLLSNKITFDQIQAAIAFWLEDAEVPGTCGKVIEFEMMKRLISIWLNGVTSEEEKKTY